MKKMKNKRYIKLLLFPIGLALVVFTVQTFINNWEDIRNLRIVSPALLLLSLPLLAVNLYATGKLFDTVLRPHGLKIKGAESFGLANLARFGNYISFGQVGFAIRMFYLKKQHTVRLRDSLSGLGISNLAFYFMAVVLILASLMLLDIAMEIKKPIAYTAILFGVLVLSFMTIIYFANSNKSNSYINKLPNFFMNFMRSVKHIVKSKNTVLLSLAWSTLLLFTFVGLTWIEFAALGLNITLVETTFLASASSLAALINITPAGIGVNEGLLLLAGGALQIPPDLILGSAIIRRVIVFSFVAMVSLIFSKQIFQLSLPALLRSIKNQNIR